VTTRTSTDELCDRLVVAVVEPPRDGVAAEGGSLLRRAAELANALGAATAELTWEPGCEADLEELGRALVDALRDGDVSVSLLADDDLGRQLAPMVALGMGTSAIVGCADVVVRDGEAVYVKPVQGGWLEREFRFAAGCTQVATIQLDAVPSGSGAVPEPGVERRTVVPTPVPDGPAPRVTRLELVPPDPRTVDLVHARRIVGVGMGSVSDRLLEAAAELAELLEGSVGATRPVVDDGRLPMDRLIGQTGRTVAPELYLALGISGSPHHVAGVQGAQHIVAVNKDEHAPIVSFSDTSFVGGLEHVLPALVRLLKALQSGGPASEAPGG
jgi:electron transfer flavoprotein alpha subunit